MSGGFECKIRKEVKRTCGKNVKCVTSPSRCSTIWYGKENFNYFVVKLSFFAAFIASHLRNFYRFEIFIYAFIDNHFDADYKTICWFGKKWHGAMTDVDGEGEKKECCWPSTKTINDKSIWNDCCHIYDIKCWTIFYGCVDEGAFGLGECEQASEQEKNMEKLKLWRLLETLKTAKQLEVICCWSQTVFWGLRFCVFEIFLRGKAFESMRLFHCTLEMPVVDLKNFD